jgi:hypothetical protein
VATPEIAPKTMAVIAAAVQAYLEQEARPVHLPRQRRTAPSAWADYGRAELMRQTTTWQLRLAH